LILTNFKSLKLFKQIHKKKHQKWHISLYLQGHAFSTNRRALNDSKAARDFANDELKPGVIERDEHQKFPTNEIKTIG
jgi:hypothetical protein